MIVKPFEGPRLKIAQGRKHALALAREVSAYAATEPFALVLQRVTATGRTMIALKGRKEIPPELSLTLGDAVHNFRAALDIAANDAITSTGITPRKVYFPFSADEAGLDEQIENKIHQASEPLKALLRSFKPYKGGNELLRAVHDLDIGDKHIALVQAAASGATPPLAFDAPTVEQIQGGRRLTFKANFGMMPTEPIDLTGYSPNPPGVETVGKLRGGEISFVIGNDLPLAGKEVCKAVNDMAAEAERVVAEIERHCALPGTS